MARLVRCFATAAWLPACCRCMAMQAGGRWLHPGDAALPPLVEVPGVPLTLLERIVKPPDAETLYEWQTTHSREEDPDPSWASVWPAAAALSARHRAGIWARWRRSHSRRCGSSQRDARRSGAPGTALRDEHGGAQWPHHRRHRRSRPSAWHRPCRCMFLGRHALDALTGRRSHRGIRSALRPQLR